LEEIVTTQFDDVIGSIEAKSQLRKYVDMMVNRENYIKIGAKVPRGVLLCGSPGCGKTLLAKAVAGEAKVKFISVCGSDFDEMFVGVGSSRVKKMFALARANAPCIVFIDEIDSIGESRTSNIHSGNKTDTLNKILAEMDGFNPRDNIMVLASTNRENSLDRALMRSGRFDSKIYIDPPNRKERVDLYKLYLRKIHLNVATNTAPLIYGIDIFADTIADNIADQLSKMSPTATGADIANICNQAAINAASKTRQFVLPEDVFSAIDDVLIGIEKRSKKVVDKELEVTAYHEAGHALIGYLLKDACPPMKLSIIPRGHGIAGYTMPEESDTNNFTTEQLTAQVYGLLGGRCAEIIKFNKATTGASNDFEKATKIVESMITKHGMYDSPMVYEMNRTSSYCVSDTKRHEIENLIKVKLTNIYDEVLNILRHHSDQLDLLAQKLLDSEYMDYEQIKELFPDFEDSVDTSTNKNKNKV